MRYFVQSNDINTLQKYLFFLFSNYCPIALLTVPLILYLSEQLGLPRRIFCPLKLSGPVCVCDYQFSDEGQSEVTERLKEMLDIDATEEDLDTSQEMPAETMEKDVWAGREEERLQSICPVVHNFMADKS